MREQLYAFDPTFLISYKDRRENASAIELTKARDLFGNIASPDSDEAVDEIFRAEGNRAIITISGPLSMAGPDFWDLYAGYGGVAYPTILKAIERASSDQFKEVLCLANTPGGEVNGSDITYQAMTALTAKKSVRCLVSGMLASAGYYIMCPAKLEATSPTDEIGSIGVIIAGYDWSSAMDQIGVKKWNIVSRNAPNKAAGFDSKGGRAVLQERADAIERIFYQRISEARGVTPEFIAENFGQGALLVARDPDSTKPDALRSKMIDALNCETGEFVVSPSNSDGDPKEESNAGPSGQANSPAQAGYQQEVPFMDLKEFLEQGPAAVAEIEKIKVDARTDATAEVNKRIAKASAVLGTEAYAGNAAIRKIAVECLEGKKSVDALDGAVGMVDMLAETGRNAAAAGEQNTQGATAPGNPDAKAIEAAEIKSMADGIANAGRPKEVK